MAKVAKKDNRPSESTSYLPWRSWRLLPYLSVNENLEVKSRGSFFTIRITLVRVPRHRAVRAQDRIEKQDDAMIVQLKQAHPDHPHLTAGQRYLVIGIEADDYRLLNDWGEPCLYPPDLFRIVDASEPAQWVCEVGEDGERYAYPPALNKPGFFEDFFDRKPEAMQTFWQTINHGLTAA